MSSTIINRIKKLERELKALNLKLRSYFIENQVFSYDNLSHVNRTLSKIAVENLRLSTYSLERTFTPIKISKNKSTELKIKPRFHYALMGFKFIGHEGWGEYGAYRRDRRIRTFFRHENGVESNVVLGNSYIIYWEGDTLKIKQESGFGEQEIELLGISLTPPELYGYSPFIEITS